MKATGWSVIGERAAELRERESIKAAQAVLNGLCNLLRSVDVNNGRWPSRCEEKIYASAYRFSGRHCDHKPRHVETERGVLKFFCGTHAPSRIAARADKKRRAEDAAWRAKVARREAMEQEREQANERALAARKELERKAQAFDVMLRALKVIGLCTQTVSFLDSEDPKALEQVQDAIALAEGRPLTDEQKARISGNPVVNGCS